MSKDNEDAWTTGSGKGKDHWLEVAWGVRAREHTLFLTAGTWTYLYFVMTATSTGVIMPRPFTMAVMLSIVFISMPLR